MLFQNKGFILVGFLTLVDKNNTDKSYLNISGKLCF